MITRWTPTGRDNYARGRNALSRLTSGSGNVAYGRNAGAHLTTENYQCWFYRWRLPYAFARPLRWLIVSHAAFDRWRS